jgi:hypothetical protein
MGGRQSHLKHVYNNSGKDIQLYRLDAFEGHSRVRGGTASHVDTDLSLCGTDLIGMFVLKSASRNNP